MTLFGQKTDTSKVDSIVNNHLRRLLETPVSRKAETPAPEAIFASAVESSTPEPAASGAKVVAFLDESLVVTAEEPAFEPMPEVVVEPISAAEDVARVAVYIIEEPAAVEPAPEVIAEPVKEPPATVHFAQSEPEVVEPVFAPVEPVADPIVAPVAVPAAAVKTNVETNFEAAPAVTDVAATLANDLARCLAGAFQNLQHHISAENQKFNASLQQQIQRLQTSVDNVASLRQPVAELASAIAEQRSANAGQIERYEQLGATVATLEQSQTRNNTELVTLRIEQLEMRATVSTHADDLAILKGTACETARRVAGMSDVLNRQNNVLRHLHAMETKRAAALERAFESLTRTELQPLLAIPA
jgi:hypothetical protein